MEPEVNQGTTTPDLLADEILTDDIVTEEVNLKLDAEESGTLTRYSSTNATNEQWRQIGERVSEVLADLPDYITEFFANYRRPLVSIGLVFGAIITVKLVLAILNAINEVPLMAPLFELVGMGYSAWFIYRYLLRASNRQELSSDFNALKEQVLGRGANP